MKATYCMMAESIKEATLLITNEMTNKRKGFKPWLHRISTVVSQRRANKWKKWGWELWRKQIAKEGNKINKLIRQKVRKVT